MLSISYNDAMLDYFKLSGKRALITGGASGIGEATVRTFSDAGAEIWIVDIDEKRAQALAGQIPGSQALRCDITDEQQVATLFKKLDRLDILVNNAGIGLVGNVEETELEDFQRLFRVNVEGTFLMTRAALPLLSAVRGTIVNIGSVAGLVGVKRRFAYCATKGAVNGDDPAVGGGLSNPDPRELYCPWYRRHSVHRGVPGKIP